MRIPAAFPDSRWALGWHGDCVSAVTKFARQRTAMFGLGIVGVIIVIIVILWLLGYIG